MRVTLKNKDGSLYREYDIQNQGDPPVVIWDRNPWRAFVREGAFDNSPPFDYRHVEGHVIPKPAGGGDLPDMGDI
jgi:hypothetical protein